MQPGRCRRSCCAAAALRWSPSVRASLLLLFTRRLLHSRRAGIGERRSRGCPGARRVSAFQSRTAPTGFLRGASVWTTPGSTLTSLTQANLISTLGRANYYFFNKNIIIILFFNNIVKCKKKQFRKRKFDVVRLFFEIVCFVFLIKLNVYVEKSRYSWLWTEVKSCSSIKTDNLQKYSGSNENLSNKNCLNVFEDCLRSLIVILVTFIHLGWSTC